MLTIETCNSYSRAPEQDVNYLESIKNRGESKQMGVILPNQR